MSTLAPSHTVTTRDPKGLKFLSIVEAAYNKAGLSEDEAQRVNDTAGGADVVGKFIANNRRADKYKAEEVPSKYGYISGYVKPKSLSDQLAILQGHFPDLGECDLSLGGQKVEAAEGLFLVPQWQKVAPTYGEAMQKVLDALSKAYGGRFKNWIAGKIGPAYLRQSARSVEGWKTLAAEQRDQDILIVHAQFGFRHRGRSVRRALEVMLSNEFGLGAFAVGIMLLTHMDRLQNVNDLWIDCAGDEFRSDADGVFSGAPVFGFVGGQLGFGSHRVDSARGCCGSVSAFLPQSKFVPSDS